MSTPAPRKATPDTRPAAFILTDHGIVGHVTFILRPCDLSWQRHSCLCSIVAVSLRYSFNSNCGPQSLPWACRMGALSWRCRISVVQARLLILFSSASPRLRGDLSFPITRYVGNHGDLWQFLVQPGIHEYPTLPW